MNKLKFLLFLILATVNCLFTKMITIKTIDELIPKIEKSLQDALVIFDVDHTLIKPKGLVGSDAWFAYEKEKRVAKGMTYKEAVSDLIKVLMPIQHKITMIPCENSTIAILHKIQEQARYVIAMTGRGIDQAKFTVDQLKFFNISFLKTSFNSQILNCSNRYLDGVSFCGDTEKGAILIELLRSLNEIPENIFIIENSLKKLEDMMKVLAIHYPKIEVLGILYENENNKSFDKQAAEKELLIIQNSQLSQVRHSNS